MKACRSWSLSGPKSPLTIPCRGCSASAQAVQRGHVFDSGDQNIDVVAQERRERRGALLLDQSVER